MSFSSSLEEYFEILFLQARYITISNEKREQIKLYISAYLDHERRQSQQTQVRLIDLLSVEIISICFVVNYLSSKSTVSLSFVNEMESRWWSVTKYSSTHKPTRSAGESNGNSRWRMLVYNRWNLHLSTINNMVKSAWWW